MKVLSVSQQLDFRLIWQMNTEYRPFTGHAVHMNISPQRTHEFTRFVYTDTHACTALRCLKGAEQARADERFVHAAPGIFNLDDRVTINLLQPHDHFSMFRRRVLREKIGIWLVDPSRDPVWSAEKQRWFFGKDYHMTPAGNRLLAEMVHEAIARRGL